MNRYLVCRLWKVRDRRVSVAGIAYFWDVTFSGPLLTRLFVFLLFLFSQKNGWWKLIVQGFLKRYTMRHFVHFDRVYFCGRRADEFRWKLCRLEHCSLLLLFRFLRRGTWTLVCLHKEVFIRLGWALLQLRFFVTIQKRSRVYRSLKITWPMFMMWLWFGNKMGLHPCLAAHLKSDLALEHPRFLNLILKLYLWRFKKFRRCMLLDYLHFDCWILFSFSFLCISSEGGQLIFYLRIFFYSNVGCLLELWKDWGIDNGRSLDGSFRQFN